MKHEEIAFHYKDCIVWIAYRQCVGDKDESVYVAGWDVTGKKGGDLYATLRRILEIQFGRDDGECLDRMAAPFLGCDRAIISSKVPGEIRVVLDEFFTYAGIPCETVSARTLSKQTLNRRWAEAMGEPLQRTYEDDGYQLALSVLTKGARDVVV